MHEQIVTIPKALVFSTDSILPEFKKRYAKLKVHALLAFALACEKSKASDRTRKWIKTWPTLKEFQTSMPIFLDSKYRRPLVISADDDNKGFCLLPPAIGGVWIDSAGKFETEFASAYMLPKQETRMKRDLTAMNGFASDQEISLKYNLGSNDLLTWMWLIVYTRSFYYDMPLRSRPKVLNEDKMCLCPFVDYFNHAEKGVSLHSKHVAS